MSYKMHKNRTPKMHKTHNKRMHNNKHLTCNYLARSNHMCKRVEGCWGKIPWRLMHLTHVFQQWSSAASNSNKMLPKMLQKCHVLHNWCNNLKHNSPIWVTT